MLVLSRRLEEKVVITHNGERLDVTLVDFNRQNKGGWLTARLGFEAPPSFVIKREEIFEGPEQPYEPARTGS